MKRLLILRKKQKKNLKLLKKYADLSVKGLKHWELRKNDRDFQVGDELEMIVIDDETKARSVMKTMLTEFFPEINSVITEEWRNVFFGWELETHWSEKFQAFK